MLQRSVTGLLSYFVTFRLFQPGLTFQPGLSINIALTKLSPSSNCSCNRDAISARLTGLKLSPGWKLSMYNQPLNTEIKACPMPVDSISVCRNPPPTRDNTYFVVLACSVGIIKGNYFQKLLLWNYLKHSPVITYARCGNRQHKLSVSGCINYLCCYGRSLYLRNFCGWQPINQQICNNIQNKCEFDLPNC
jgi:hypothetical protein